VAGRQLARFGLVHVDYATQKRAVKRSGEFFAKMIEERGVTPEM
jgi:beta-glucosidase